MISFVFYTHSSLLLSLMGKYYLIVVNFLYVIRLLQNQDDFGLNLGSQKSYRGVLCCISRH